MSNEAHASILRRVTSTYLHAFEHLLHHIDVEAIHRIASRLACARDSGAVIYVAGNGGSAAIASHWVNDLCKATKRSGCPPMRAMSLTDNVSWLTALANDEGYESVFSRQLESFARPGDVLVVISSSGNSANLLRAVELAQVRGLITIGFLGFDGGKLRTKVDDYLWVSSERGAYGLVEPAHEMICHILTICLAETRCPSELTDHAPCAS